MSLRNAALILLGHGSTLNGDSSAPTYRHAEEIRRRDVFAEVHVGFWKEEPNFRQTCARPNGAKFTSCRISSAPAILRRTLSRANSG